MRGWTAGLMAAALLLGGVTVAGLGSGAQAADAPASAGQPGPTPEQLKAAKAEKDRLDAIQATFHPQTGVIKLPKAKAVLNLGDKYYFLDPADSRKALVDGWNNPPNEADDVLGMIFPKGKTLWDNDFGVVLSFDQIGVVDETDATKQDFDKVLDQMRQAANEQNEQRRSKGYDTVQLVGWAQDPTYDPANHNLIWARDFIFGSSPNHTLNYDVRHLGRHGVLSMNFVSAMPLLEQLRPQAAELAKTAEFEGGARYADKQPGDKKAGMGLAGLVAGGAGLVTAKKVGLLGVLLLVLKKAGVFIVAALGGVGAWFRKLFGLKPKADKTTTSIGFGGDDDDKPPPPNIVS